MEFCIFHGNSFQNGFLADLTHQGEIQNELVTSTTLLMRYHYYYLRKIDSEGKCRQVQVGSGGILDSSGQTLAGPGLASYAVLQLIASGRDFAGKSLINRFDAPTAWIKCK